MVVAHRSVLYTSRLAPGAGEAAVADILTVSRRRNPERGLTGMLVRSGGHFVQVLEGPAAAVEGVMRSIATDPRHYGVAVLHWGEPRGGRAFSQWSMDYLRDDSLEAAIHAVAGPAARHDEDIARLLARMAQRATAA